MDTAQIELLRNLEKIEASAEKVVSAQDKCLMYEKYQRKSQEALNYLKENSVPDRVWACFSHQFFKFPKNSLKTTLKSDVDTLSIEIRSLREEVKRNLDDLRRLEKEDPLRGFNLNPLSPDEIYADQVIAQPPQDKSHRRYNPLTQEWVIVSPNRINRPWTGAVEKNSDTSLEGTTHASGHATKSTALSPGGVRASGAVNPFYDDVFTFPNDFPAFSARSNGVVRDLTKEAQAAKSEDPLFAWAQATGECFVTCFHPRPDLTLALMTHEEIVKVIDEWARLTRQCSDLGYQWIQVFENRGEIMGCSNPHPHCQVWTSDFVPTRALRSDFGQSEYFSRNGSPLLLDYAQRELLAHERIVVSNDDWVVLVPWWAAWPFESLLLPRRRHVGRLDELTDEEKSTLANAMSRILIAYDNLFATSFPYSFGWHQTPLQAPEKAVYWQLHGIYLPPLLRSATVKKHMVGYELLAEMQRDLTPERAAALLRDAAAREHYSKK